MIITKRSLPRRTLLRGMGAAVALPLLDAMVPALTAQVKTVAAPTRRLSFVYIPNGVVIHLELPDGRVLDTWTPTGSGTALQLAPIMAPLEPFTDRMVVVSGLGSRPMEAQGDGNGDHARSCSAWLSAVHPKRTETAPEAGTTLDQFVAEEIGADTQLRSLQLAVDDFTLLGGCESGYACSYFNTLSWRTPTSPLPCEINPRVVFERMFGDGGGEEARRAQLAGDRSILDSITGEIAHLQAGLGPRDRTRVDEYLEGVRELERRIRTIEEQQDRALDIPAAPIGIPDAFDDHVKLMFDLQVLAYQGDITRVITFLLAREGSYRSYGHIGVPEAHHGLSHHGNEVEKIEKMGKINTYHAQLFAYYLDKLRSTPDGDGSLLDHSVVLYGSGMSNGNLHNHYPLPLLLAGGAAGRLTGNRHLRYETGTPMANLLVNIGELAGAREVDAIGDSTGRLDSI
ncbi:MAG: DUF1552 domain-containing protein [Acidimicrobiia bacterium]|nr:DUF1552 domain-containing protein [Acidimicrobiia bacterium]